MVYKAVRFGLRLKRVSARWTSTYCPRCGAKGQKIIESCNKTVNPLGRFFLCRRCHFTADRDYIAALNIHRMYIQQCKKRYNLHHASVLHGYWSPA